MIDPPDDEDLPDDLEEESTEAPPFGRSRTSHKEERVANERAISTLVLRLVELSPARLALLDLPEFVTDRLADLRLIRSAPARARMVRQVRSLLRDLDWALIVRRLDGLGTGAGLEAEMPSEAARWAVELPIQRDVGISRFLERYPDADRRRLRQLVMNVARSSEDKRQKVRRQLEQLLEAIVRGDG